MRLNLEVYDKLLRSEQTQAATQRNSSMPDETKNPVISFDVRVKPGRAGTDPEAPDWEVCELEDGVIKNNADIYDNMTLAEANQIAGMWRSKKEEAEAGAVSEATQ
jgi:hypothetical protein